MVERNLDEAEAVGRGEERGRRACRVKEPRGGAADEAPATGGGVRIDPCLVRGDGDAAGRDAETRAREAGAGERGVEAFEVGEPGREADVADGVCWRGVTLDDFFRGQRCQRGDVGEIGCERGVVAGRDGVEGRFCRVGWTGGERGEDGVHCRGGIGEEWVERDRDGVVGRGDVADEGEGGGGEDSPGASGGGRVVRVDGDAEVTVGGPHGGEQQRGRVAEQQSEERKNSRAKREKVERRWVEV